MEEVKVEELINAESKRISERFNKNFLDCDDIVKITGLGKENVRNLMNTNTFPIIKVGRRRIVSVIAFSTWMLNNKR